MCACVCVSTHPQTYPSSVHKTGVEVMIQVACTMHPDLVSH